MLSKFYCFILKFTDSIQWHLHSTIEPIQAVLKIPVIVILGAIIST